MRKKIELLAPAGNLEILKAAVDMGADAVYCGLGRFNARVNADNLDLYGLEEALITHTFVLQRFILRSTL